MSWECEGHEIRRATRRAASSLADAPLTMNVSPSLVSEAILVLRDAQAFIKDALQYQIIKYFRLAASTLLTLDMAKTRGQLAGDGSDEGGWGRTRRWV